VVVMVPEAGDEVQTMKAGLMEIADVFVVNKSDRPDADTFVKNLRLMLAPAFHHHRHQIEIVKTIAISRQGIAEMYAAIQKCLQQAETPEKKFWLLAEKAYHLIQQKRMSDIDKTELLRQIKAQEGNFNLYKFINRY
jgi:LAO/AO transport system kinase